MTQRHQPNERQSRQRWWQAMRGWQRVLVVMVVLGALAISTALIYFHPDDSTLRTSTSPAVQPRGTAAPDYPPGVRYYYRRSQWQPLDQQEPVQP